MKNIALILSAALILTACGGGSTTPAPTTTTPPKNQTPNPNTVKTFNQQQTEKMTGRWVFTTIYGTSTFKSTYAFAGPVVESDSHPGEYGIAGRDELNILIYALYNARNKEFNMLVPNPIIDLFQIFTFTDANTIVGCEYVVPHDRDLSGICHPLKGVRISATATAASGNISNLEERLNTLSKP